MAEELDDNGVPISRPVEPPPPPPKKKLPPPPEPTMLDKAKNFFGVGKSARRGATDDASNYGDSTVKLAKGGFVRADGKALRGKTKGTYK